MSTWVLILQPSGKGWPAVIGGYSTAEEAEVAGKLACKTPAVRGMTEQQEQDWYAQAGGAYEIPWANYTVIPGAASQGSS